MVEQDIAQALPRSRAKPKPVEKGSLGAPCWMTACQEVLGHLSLLDNRKMHPGQSLRLQRNRPGFAGSGPKAGGGLRRFEAAS
jgi:hypothetical protein